MIWGVSLHLEAERPCRVLIHFAVVHMLLLFDLCCTSHGRTRIISTDFWRTVLLDIQIFLPKMAQAALMARWMCDTPAFHSFLALIG